ncbi:hypothetical protein L7F22_020638 [Adiantum nelumboides]|nr:hypothetical protein [Adiantum nelumboides]
MDLSPPNGQPRYGLRNVVSQSASLPYLPLSNHKSRCLENCELALYFSPQEDLAFEAVHRLFGVKNFVRLLKELPLQVRQTAAWTMKLEAQLRMADPVHGIMQLMHQLKLQARTLEQDLIKVKLAILNTERRRLHGIAHEQAHLLQAVAATKSAEPHEPPLPTICRHGLEGKAFAPSLICTRQSSASSHVVSFETIANNSGAQGDHHFREASHAPPNDDSQESSLAIYANPKLDMVGLDVLDNHGFTSCGATNYTESTTIPELPSSDTTEPVPNQVSLYESSYLNAFPISSTFVDSIDFVAPLDSIDEDNCLITTSSDEPNESNLFTPFD